MIRSRRQKIGAQISLIGSFCLAGFIFAQLAILVPPRILDAQWQFAISNGLVNQALLAVFGFSLICSAPAIAGSEENENLYSRRDLISRLAIIPAIGYLLLIPVFAFNLARGIDAGIQLEKSSNKLAPHRSAKFAPLSRRRRPLLRFKSRFDPWGHRPCQTSICRDRSIASAKRC